MSLNKLTSVCSRQHDGVTLKSQLSSPRVHELQKGSYSCSVHIATCISVTSNYIHNYIWIQVPRSKPLGIVLISPHKKCLLCSSKLQLRKDRPAPVTIYDDILGTVPGTCKLITLNIHLYTATLNCVDNIMCGSEQ